MDREILTCYILSDNVNAFKLRPIQVLWLLIFEPELEDEVGKKFHWVMLNRDIQGVWEGYLYLRRLLKVDLDAI